MPGPINRKTMTVVATCGHKVTFKTQDDENLANRIAKFRDRACGPCRAADDKAKAAAAKAERRRLGIVSSATKGKIYYMATQLPPGTALTLERQDDGRWRAELRADNESITYDADTLIGAQWSVMHRYIKSQASAKATSQGKE